MRLRDLVGPGDNNTVRQLPVIVRDKIYIYIYI